MIKLIEPCKTYLPSYREAFEEFRALGVSTYGLTDPDSCDVLEKFENYRLERNLKPDRVGSHYFWLVDEEKSEFIGEIAIRHRLNEALSLRGGHIGYCVRYGCWGKGYATQMLALGLEEARKLGLTRVLVTCNDTNLASARVMEKNGFQFQDKVDVEGILSRRYWKTP